MGLATDNHKQEGKQRWFDESEHAVTLSGFSPASKSRTTASAGYQTFSSSTARIVRERSVNL
jgi:hypothetical protein